MSTLQKILKQKVECQKNGMNPETLIVPKDIMDSIKRDLDRSFGASMLNSFESKLFGMKIVESPFVDEAVMFDHSHLIDAAHYATQPRKLRSSDFINKTKKIDYDKEISDLLEKILKLQEEKRNAKTKTN